MGLFMDFARFVRKEKKWWIIPMVVLLLLLGSLLVFAEGSVFANFIYTLF